MPIAETTDFTPEQMAQWTKPAKNLPGSKREKLLDKVARNNSDNLWGDLDRCTLACTITAQMFTKRAK